jgi:GT2 family glycosyltransferase
VSAHVAAVVLGWNGRDDTLACLRSLRGATYPDLSVVVVDNASTDGGPDAVAAEFPEVTLIRLDENRGFAGGVNAGVTAALAAEADHVLLLNNDATVDAGFVEPLVDALEPGVGAACSQILDADGATIWYAGADYDARRGHQGRHTGYGGPPIPAGVHPYDTDRACGGAMLVPRAALDDVGLLDEALFAYAEDVDWSVRARRAGLRLVVVPASIVRHRVSSSTGGASSPDSLYYALRNGLAVAERAAPLGRWGTLRRRAEAAAAFSVQALRSRSRVAGLRAVAHALRDARRGRLGRRGAP